MLAVSDFAKSDTRNPYVSRVCRETCSKFKHCPDVLFAMDVVV